MTDTRERYQRDAATRYDRAMGRPSMMDDITPVREHLLMLKSHGCTQAWIAYEAVTDDGTITKVISGKRHRLTVAVANRILAVRVGDYDGPAAGMLVSSLGIQRRLNALRCDGYTVNFLASQLNKSFQHTSQMCNRQQPTAWIGTYNAVVALYDRLAGKKPSEFDISEVQSKRAFAYGSKAGGFPSIYWNDERLDDPDGFPDITGACGTVRGRHLHNVANEEACGACKLAAAEDSKRRRQRQKDIEAGLVEPIPREGRDTGRKDGRWQDDVAVMRLRSDFETYTDYVVMEERYGTSIGNLKKIALRDGLWQHQHAEIEPRKLKKSSVES